MENQGEIVVILNSTDHKYSYDTLSVTYESSDSEIISALAPVLQEEEGFDLNQEFQDGAYTLKRMDNSRTIFLFPKSTAGI